MLEICRGLDFGEKAVAADGSGEFGPQNFDRDFAVVAQVVSQIDGRHPSRAQLTLDPIPVGEGLLQSLQGWFSNRSDGIHLSHLWHHLAKPRFDPLAQRDGRRAAPRAGAAEAEQQHPVGLVEVHDLDLSPVRGDIGPECIEGLFDALQGVGHRE